ncbi:Lrp/AsnC family transcriptional regulator [Candidatus Woesearchaeota archaeon]|nr:Lrp/AsnC family transcriptional regulator [Candidatus Woesearchaeota archaeon]
MGAEDSNSRNFEPDDKDFLILEHLERDAGLTTKKLAIAVSMPQTTVHNRIRRLKEAGVIKKYVAILDYRKLNKPLTAYVLLDISYEDHSQISKKLAAMPFVTEICAVTGANDIIIKLRAKDAEDLGEIVLKNLKRMGGVARTETMLVLETAK